MKPLILLSDAFVINTHCLKRARIFLPFPLTDIAAVKQEQFLPVPDSLLSINLVKDYATEASKRGKVNALFNLVEAYCNKTQIFV